MIHAFIDCDVIIDLLTRREPHFKESALLFQSALDKQIQLFTSPLAIANVHYMVKKSKDEQQTRNAISKLLTIIEIADMTKNTVIKALNSDMKDFRFEESKSEGSFPIIAKSQFSCFANALALTTPPISGDTTSILGYFCLYICC